MTELERWITDHPPISGPLTAEETAALRSRVAARRPKAHRPPMWRIPAAVAALCLVAAGALILGLFHPMSTVNEASALVQKYGTVPKEPITFVISGHTVSIHALLRGQNTLRILYDVDNAKGLKPDDLVWDTANFRLAAPDDDLPNSLYSVYNADVGPCGGYAVGPWEGRNQPAETDTLSCFVDIPLVYSKSNRRTLYIGDLTDYDAKASIEITLPDAPATVTAEVEKTITMKGGPWFRYDMTDEAAEAYPSSSFDVEKIRIEPLSVSVIGKSHGSRTGETSRYDIQSRVKLFRADGSELTYGWGGKFYQGNYAGVGNSAGLMVMRVDSYDIIDPEAVAYITLDGERFDVK